MLYQHKPVPKNEKRTEQKGRVVPVTEYTEDQYLAFAGIRTFALCKRQWAFIYIERYGKDPLYFAGSAFLREGFPKGFPENSSTVVSALSLQSERLGVSGFCSAAVIRRRQRNGTRLPNRPGCWFVTPTEGWNGCPELREACEAQLCIEAICIEELYGGKVEMGYLYRTDQDVWECISLTETRRRKAEAQIVEMHELVKNAYTSFPRVSKQHGDCNHCEHRNYCLPTVCGTVSASAYLREEIFSID